MTYILYSYLYIRTSLACQIIDCMASLGQSVRSVPVPALLADVHVLGSGRRTLNPPTPHHAQARHPLGAARPRRRQLGRPARPRLAAVGRGRQSVCFTDRPARMRRRSLPPPRPTLPVVSAPASLGGGTNREACSHVGHDTHLRLQSQCTGGPVILTSCASFTHISSFTAPRLMCVGL